MTDEILGNSGSVSPESQQQAVPVENVSQESQTSTPSPVGLSQIPQEEMLTLTEANNRTAGAKRKAYDKGVKDGRSQPEQPTQSVANNNGAANESQISSMIESKMSDMVKKQQENLATQNRQQEVNKIVAELTSKMDVAKQNIPNYEQDIAAVNHFNDVPAILASVYSLDNAADVLHHLSKNRKDIPTIDALARVYQGRPGEINMGAEELKKISDRLKQNANGKNSAHAPEPISQIETNSRDGIGDSSPQSIADYKRMSIYKG